MFEHIGKAIRTIGKIYGEPGAGVSVMSAPDSVLDFYRMSNVRLPLDGGEPAAPKPLWVWGGGTAVRQTKLTLRPSGRHSTCSSC